MTFDSATFRHVLGHYPTGVTVITAMDEDRPVGFAIGSFASVSLEPPLVLFCSDHRSSTWPRIEAAGAFCVNILADDQIDVCRQFSSKADDKFVGIDWDPSAQSHSPRLAGVLAWIDCELEAVHPGGDHDIVVGRVLDLDLQRHDAGPLVFFQGGFGRYDI